MNKRLEKYLIRRLDGYFEGWRAYGEFGPLIDRTEIVGDILDHIRNGCDIREYISDEEWDDVWDEVIDWVKNNYKEYTPDDFYYDWDGTLCRIKEDEDKEEEEE